MVVVSIYILIYYYSCYCCSISQLNTVEFIWYMPLYIDKCISWGARIVYGDIFFPPPFITPAHGQPHAIFRELRLKVLNLHPVITQTWGQDIQSSSFQKIWCSLLWGCWVHVTTTKTKRERKKKETDPATGNSRYWFSTVNNVNETQDEYYRVIMHGSTGLLQQAFLLEFSTVYM